MSSTIAVGVDGTHHSFPALVWAAAAAAERDAVLELVHAVGQSVSGFDLTLDRVLEQRGKSVVEAAAEAAESLHAGLTVRTMVSPKGPADALVAASEHADLVVLGSRPFRRPGRVLPGPRSYQVAAASHAPVVVVPDLAPESAHGVVVGVDGLPDGAAALTLAASEASRMGEQLTLVHAWEEPSPYVGLDYQARGLGDAIREAGEAVLRTARQAVLDQYPDLEVGAQLVRSTPARALLEAASSARLLVVGSRGRHGVSRVLLGSVSHAVLLGATCPVLVARPQPTKP
jgi:nucleotide-binding universal stress UspA family protein